MKSTFVFLALLCLIQTVNAQVSVGVRSSFSVTTAPEASKEITRVEPAEIYNFSYLKSSNNFSYGLIIHDENDKLFASAEVLYRKSKHEFQIEDMIESFGRDQATREFTYEHTDISIPVAAGVKISKFKLGAGPILNYRVSSTSTLAEDGAFSSQDPKLNMGFQFMAGFMVNQHVHIDLKRELSFNRVGNNFNYYGQPIKLNSNAHTLSLSIGIFI